MNCVKLAIGADAYLNSCAPGVRSVHLMFIRLSAEVTKFATDHSVFSGFRPSDGQSGSNLGRPDSRHYSRLADKPSRIFASVWNVLRRL